MQFVKAFLVMTILLATTTRCGVDEEILFEEVLVEEFEIFAGLNTVETHYFVIQNVFHNLRGRLLQSGVNENTVVRVLPNYCKLEPVLDFVDWGICERVEVFAVNPLNINERYKSFFLNTINLNEGSVLELFNTGIDLYPLFQNDLIDLEVGITLRQFTNTNIRARLTFTYAVYEEI